MRVGEKKKKNILSFVFLIFNHKFPQILRYYSLSVPLYPRPPLSCGEYTYKCTAVMVYTVRHSQAPHTFLIILVIIGNQNLNA